MMQTPTMTTTKIGIVTYKSGSGAQALLHVWCARFPLKEYKFPACSKAYTDPDQSIKIGTLVKFEATRDIDAVQEDTRIWPVNEPGTLGRLEIVHVPGDWQMPASFWVKVNFSFPPVSAGNYFERELMESQSFGCHAIAYSCEFGKVALMSQVPYKRGIFYTGFVGRISPDKDSMAQLMGTLWVLRTDGVPFKEVSCPETVAKLRQHMPWKEHMIMMTTPNVEPLQKQQPQGFLSSLSAPPRQLIDLLTPPTSSSSSSSYRLNFPSTTSSGAIGARGGSSSSSTSSTVVVGGIGNGNNGASNKFNEHEQEELFGKLVSLKLAWLAERNPGAAIHAQSMIMSALHDVKMRVLYSPQSPGNRNPQSPNHAVNNNFGGLGGGAFF